MSSGPSPSIWSRPEPGARGASHSREEIAAAAIRLADAEGIDAVSMRRVAAELGAGTMTLYHYVKNKDELMELVSDAIMGEVLIPDGEMPADWRRAMAELARRSHAVFLAHPWTVDVAPGTEGGPNGLKHFEQSLAASDSLAEVPAERGPLILNLAAVAESAGDYARALQQFDAGIALLETSEPQMDSLRLLLKLGEERWELLLLQRDELEEIQDFRLEGLLNQQDQPQLEASRSVRDAVE